MLKKITPIFFLFIIFYLIISSLFPQELAHKFFYQSPWFKILWGIVSMCLAIGAANLLKRKLFTFAVVYIGFLLILLGGLLTSILAVEGFIEIKEGQKVDSLWIEDNLPQPLGFSLSLKDFSVELYPEQREGMRFVKSYKTSVAISKDGSLLKEATIEVNRPLRFRGFSLYQYGYDAEFPNQTVLQVVKDPGLPFAYAGYIVLLMGMLFSFKRAFFRL